MSGDFFKELFTPSIDVSQLATKVEPPAYEDTRLKEMAEDIKKPLYDLEKTYREDQKRSSRIGIATLIVAALALIVAIVSLLYDVL